MKHILTTALLLTSMVMGAWAQGKTVYIPEEWRNRTDTLLYKKDDPDNKYTWSKSRSVESDNVIVLWDKGYGATLPSKSASAYRVDEQDLLKKCEEFYDLEINRLGFVDPVKSNLAKYKVMVLLNHTTDWVCYGGGYDFQVSALWLGPSACKPVGHSVAHEVGHSFHYMCYAEHSGHKNSSTDNTGFHLACGNGQAIWEQTAQWQAAQSYPELMFDQSISVFRKSHNMAFSHEWHRYQSYWLHYFLCQYYQDPTTVAQVWNTPMTGQTDRQATDFNQALMKLKGLDAKALFRLYYDYAARCATWDLDACAPYREPYIGDFEYRCVALGDTAWQVALASAPQTSGFNIVPLKVPEAGTEVTVNFTALPTASKLAEGDPAELMNGETQWGKTTRTTYIRTSNSSYRGFRLGFVALMQDGTRQYIDRDSLYCTTNKEVTAQMGMTVPQGVSRLWLIVVPAPTKYAQHKWDENANNDEHWPYRFSVKGTTLGQKAVVYMNPTIDGRPVADATFTYDVYLPQRSDYVPVGLTLQGKAIALLGTAFQMAATEIGDKMQAYSASGPSAGKVMFYPLNPKTQATVNRASTANGYGHWFNASGNVSDYGSGYLYSEFTPSSLTFSIGQYPGRPTAGKDYTIGQALCYCDAEGNKAVARFVFRVHVTDGQQGTELAETVYNDPTMGLSPTRVSPVSPASGAYTLLGQKARQPLHRGIYIVDGSKRVVK